MILTTPLRDFNNWVCYHGNCTAFYLNITILYSYLQTNRSQIAYSQTLVNQNVSLPSPAFHVTSLTDVTIVLAQLGSGFARDFWQTTMTNETIAYPLIGYTEGAGTILTLPNISMGLIVAGVAGSVILSEAQRRLHPSGKSKSYRQSAEGKCSACGGENLFFAEKCRHCGRTLQEKAPMLEAQSQ